MTSTLPTRPHFFAEYLGVYKLLEEYFEWNYGFWLDILEKYVTTPNFLIWVIAIIVFASSWCRHKQFIKYIKWSAFGEEFQWSLWHHYKQQWNKCNYGEEVSQQAGLKIADWYPTNVTCTIGRRNNDSFERKQRHWRDIYNDHACDHRNCRLC